MLREQHALFNRDLTPLALPPAATADVRQRGYSHHGGAAAAGFTAPACSTAQLHTWECNPVKKCLIERAAPWYHSRREFFLVFTRFLFVFLVVVVAIKIHYYFFFPGETRCCPEGSFAIWQRCPRGSAEDIVGLHRKRLEQDWSCQSTAQRELEITES